MGKLHDYWKKAKAALKAQSEQALILTTALHKLLDDFAKDYPELKAKVANAMMNAKK